MIVEQSANKESLATNLSRNFTDVDENAIYYISGYVIKKLLHQYKTHSGEATEYLEKATLNFLGDNQDSIETKLMILAWIMGKCEQPKLIVVV